MTLMGTGGDDCDYAEIPSAISGSWREKRLTEGKNLAETQRTQRGDGKRLTEEKNLAEAQRTQRGDEKRLTEGKESRRDAKNAKRGWEAAD